MSNVRWTGCHVLRIELLFLFFLFFFCLGVCYYTHITEHRGVAAHTEGPAWPQQKLLISVRQIHLYTLCDIAHWIYLWGFWCIGVETVTQPMPCCAPGKYAVLFELFSDALQTKQIVCQFKPRWRNVSNEQHFNFANKLNPVFLCTSLQLWSTMAA